MLTRGGNSFHFPPPPVLHPFDVDHDDVTTVPLHSCQFDQWISLLPPSIMLLRYATEIYAH